MEEPRRGTRLAAQTGQWGRKRTVVPSHLMWQTWGLDACLAAQCSFGNDIGRTSESILRHGQILSNKHKGVSCMGMVSGWMGTMAAGVQRELLLEK